MPIKRGSGPDWNIALLVRQIVHIFAIFRIVSFNPSKKINQVAKLRNNIPSQQAYVVSRHNLNKMPVGDFSPGVVSGIFDRVKCPTCGNLIYE